MAGAETAAWNLGVGEGKDKSHTRVPAPSEVKVADGDAYLHITPMRRSTASSSTSIRRARSPLRGRAADRDMSSDFLWRPFDVTKFGMVYAGAQKNIGPSGVVVAVVSKGLLDRGRKDIPKIFQFRTHAENKSLYNTPPTFGVYMVRNVLSWLKDRGACRDGEGQQEKGGAPLRRHRRKRRIFPVAGGAGEPLGDERGLPAPDPELEERFIAEAKKQG